MGEFAAAVAGCCPDAPITFRWQSADGFRDEQAYVEVDARSGSVVVESFGDLIIDRDSDRLSEVADVLAAAADDAYQALTDAADDADEDTAAHLAEVARDVQRALEDAGADISAPPTLGGAA